MPKKQFTPVSLTDSGALPAGGKTDRFAGDKVVEAPTTRVARMCVRLTRKPEAADSKIFKPLDPNDIKAPTRGKQLHTDPFAADRERVVQRRPFTKITTPRGKDVDVPKRQLKSAPVPSSSSGKQGLISASGAHNTSPKRIMSSRGATTMHNVAATPQRNPANNRRYAASPISQSQSTADLASSGSQTSRVVSQVFSSASMSPGADEPRSRGKRMSLAQTSHMSMEGVFRPLRPGRVVAIQPTVPPYAIGQNTGAPVTARVTAR